jgi:hypothetical protein
MGAFIAVGSVAAEGQQGGADVVTGNNCRLCIAVIVTEQVAAHWDLIFAGQALGGQVQAGLEERGLLQRQRDDLDRRRQWLLLSEQGRVLLEQAPSLLPPEFVERFAGLEQWER